MDVTRDTGQSFLFSITCFTRNGGLKSNALLTLAQPPAVLFGEQAGHAALFFEQGSVADLY
jgi:hypothetical protein